MSGTCAKCGDTYRARAIVDGGQVNDRTGAGRDIAARAFHQKIAAPTILRDVNHLDRSTRKIDASQVAEHEVAACRQRELSRWQDHRAVNRKVATVNRQLRPQRIAGDITRHALRSEEHTYELQSLMRISYAVFCFKKTRRKNERITTPT